ncbi:hypothetical protein FZEAL_10185 [Fusarium zealandicum]|uniref:CBS domain-containing protein n=1 Tax=Fusarium zealandicum TaxID=1053134 RepID=A0A8H4U4J4_9HYPO|nr:hypothetical protein FZEAL_10185 [Fusarium zealandicum]
MEGNSEADPVRGDQGVPSSTTQDRTDVDSPSEPQGCQGQSQVQDEVQIDEDPAKAHVESWIKTQIEGQPQLQPPPSEPLIMEREGDDSVGELPRGDTSKDDATSSGATGTTAGGPGATAIATGTETPRGRTRAGSTSTGPSMGTSTTGVPHGHVPQFVAPSSYLRRRTSTRSAMAPTEPTPPSPLDKDQLQGLNAIREFLRVRTSYDVLPLSFRLIVLDTGLLIKKAIHILIQNSIVSAPLWNSKTSRFAGILTSTDFINVIQYYWQFPDEIGKLDQFRLNSLRGRPESSPARHTHCGRRPSNLLTIKIDIEKAIGAIPIETASVHPSKPLYEACRRMLKTRARRIPLVDVDSETNKEMVVSVITQYRILKFIAVNNEHNTVLLKKTVRDIGLGTYTDIATAHMSSSVLDVVHLMVEKNISCVPVVDGANRLLNVFEAVDVIPCIKGGIYDDLDGSVGEALCKRPDDSPGIYTCSEDDRLDSIFDTIRKSRVHRLIVVDDDNKLKGILSLSDILKYVLFYGVEDTTNWT